MKPSELKKSISVESYDKKTAENYRNLLGCRKAHNFPNYHRYQFHIFIAKIEDFNEDCIKSSRPYLLYYLRNKQSKSIAVGPGRVGPVHRLKRLS